MKNILVTGGAGFIGSNFLAMMSNTYPDYQFINFDLLTYAGDLKNLSEIEDNNNYVFVEGDIRDLQLVDRIFKEKNITDVIHFAAESHVDNSISSPESFMTTNIIGTYNLLEVARRNWQGNFSDRRFLHVSTDEVYGSLGKTGYFSENSKYAPNSPYSASKASADMIVRSYFHTYGLPVLTTNCSNNYGPKQHMEKLIPTIIRKALAEEPIPIYGDGKNIRDWLYVEDHARAIDTVFKNGILGEVYLIGGGSEVENIEIANKICKLLDESKPKSSGSYQDQITFVTDRLGHDFRYAIDHSKLTNELDWRPEESFVSGLSKTVRWYLEKICTIE